jgi:outer membrane protein assembly factor BamC
LVGVMYARSMRDFRSRISAFRVSLLLVAVSNAGMLGGCSLFGGDDRDAYEAADEARPLELPPDLVQPVADSRMAIPRLRNDRVSALETARPGRDVALPRVAQATTTESSEQVLPEYPGMRVRHQGAVRWLEVDTDPAVLWPRLNNFWRQAEIDLAREDPRLGIIQTEWIQPAGAELRDSYRLRLERQDADTTNVFISHRGAVMPSDAEARQWQTRLSDPELEAEYLTRLMVYLGEPAQSAKQQVAAARDEGTEMRLDRIAGIPVLVVKGQFPHVWQLTGVALDRAGLPVEAEDAGSGTYYFRYQPAPAAAQGMLTGLPNKDDSVRLDEDGRYQVHLLDQPGQTLITAQAAEREALPPAAAEEILMRLIASMQGRVTADAQAGALPARIGRRVASLLPVLGRTRA